MVVSEFKWGAPGTAFRKKLVARAIRSLRKLQSRCGEAVCASE